MRKRPYASLDSGGGADSGGMTKAGNARPTLRTRTAEERSYMNYTGSNAVTLEILMDLGLITEDDLTDVAGKKTLLVPPCKLRRNKPKASGSVAILASLSSAAASLMTAPARPHRTPSKRTPHVITMLRRLRLGVFDRALRAVRTADGHHAIHYTHTCLNGGGSAGPAVIDVKEHEREFREQSARSKLEEGYVQFWSEVATPTFRLFFDIDLLYDLYTKFVASNRADPGPFITDDELLRLVRVLHDATREFYTRQSHIVDRVLRTHTGPMDSVPNVPFANVDDLTDANFDIVVDIVRVAGGKTGIHVIFPNLFVDATRFEFITMWAQKRTNEVYGTPSLVDTNVVQGLITLRMPGSDKIAGPCSEPACVSARPLLPTTEKAQTKAVKKAMESGVAEATARKDAQRAVMMKGPSEGIITGEGTGTRMLPPILNIDRTESFLYSKSNSSPFRTWSQCGRADCEGGFLLANRVYRPGMCLKGGSLIEDKTKLRQLSTSLIDHMNACSIRLLGVATPTPGFVPPEGSSGMGTRVQPDLSRMSDDAKRCFHELQQVRLKHGSVVPGAARGRLDLPDHAMSHPVPVGIMLDIIHKFEVSGTRPYASARVTKAMRADTRPTGGVMNCYRVFLRDADYCICKGAEHTSKGRVWFEFTERGYRPRCTSTWIPDDVHRRKLGVPCKKWRADWVEYPNKFSGPAIFGADITTPKELNDVRAGRLTEGPTHTETTLRRIYTLKSDEDAVELEEMRKKRVEDQRSTIKLPASVLAMRARKLKEKQDRERERKEKEESERVIRLPPKAGAGAV